MMEEKELNISNEDTGFVGSKLIMELNIPPEESDKEEDENIYITEEDKNLKVTKESLLEQIKNVQEELERRKQHSQRIAELNKAVEEWKADFARALEKIQDTFAFVK
uniref:Uncharacterized protein n=1 Tax=Ceratitis capitata TaxID=7213 RepID=W8BN14_CERCA